LSPKNIHFIPAKHLHQLDEEGLDPALYSYLEKEQKQKRNIASSTLPAAFLPENHPKFALPYFLVPEEMSQFIQAETSDDKVLDQLVLKISGKKHYKFFVHPAHEADFNYLRGAYTYVTPDRTEFYASPTDNPYTVIIWNRNNPDRKPFLTKLNIEMGDQKETTNRQIVKDLPAEIKLAHDKR
jgi:hypothetical protein